MSNKEEIYLDTYVLQQDMRIRMPKQILTNLNVIKGETMFNIFINIETNELILRVTNDKKDGTNND